MLNNIEYTCIKCHSSLIKNECTIKWFEYGSYSQKKIHCKCGCWSTLETIEDRALSLNEDDRYYEYDNKYNPRLRRLRKWEEYMKCIYDCDFYENDNIFYN